MRRRLTVLVLLGVVTAWVVRRGPFRVLVEGESMSPTLRPGDQLLCLRPGAIRKGHLVVVRAPGHGFEMVKRVAAVAGEEGLGRGEHLVVGDNPAASTDGRSFGPVRDEDIAGVVLLRYLPRPAWLRR